MNKRHFSFEHLSEGQFDLYPDGSLLKSEQASVLGNSRLDNELYLSLSTSVGIDPILVSGNGTHVLLDAGLGLGLDHKSANPNISNIRTNMEIFDVSPSDIDHVVLSHLHHDHIAGLTYTDNQSRIQATLPNATIWVQRKEWNHALEAIDTGNDTSDMPYQLDDFYRLVADGRVQFLDEGTTEIIPGIEAIRTGGHTPGHQIVRIRNNDQLAYYFGDLVPNEHYLGFKMMKDIDLEITESRQIKVLLLKQAYHDNADILFYHSVHLKHGKLTKDTNRHFVLKSNRNA
ncbi:MAG: MBL fold metallo-hydrolase [Balneolales bacterium]|nr:MBL fold metallo-hydrolase [Balneolales bacterium]